MLWTETKGKSNGILHSLCCDARENETARWLDDAELCVRFSKQHSTDATVTKATASPPPTAIATVTAIILLPDAKIHSSPPLNADGKVTESPEPSRSANNDGKKENVHRQKEATGEEK
jgi:hypothetical protein